MYRVPVIAIPATLFSLSTLDAWTDCLLDGKCGNWRIIKGLLLTAISLFLWYACWRYWRAEDQMAGLELESNKDSCRGKD